MSKTFTFDKTWQTFFNLGNPECFHWDNWALVLRSYPYTYVSSPVMPFWANLDSHRHSIAPEWYSCNSSFRQNLEISEQTLISHVSCLKHLTKLHSMIQLICWQPLQLLHNNFSHYFKVFIGCWPAGASRKCPIVEIKMAACILFCYCNKIGASLEVLAFYRMVIINE